MAIVSSGQETGSRKDVLFVFFSQGVAGLLLMLFVTFARLEQTRSILASLGTSAWLLIAIFFVYACALALLKFELTDLIFVSLIVTAFISMFPLLGVVLSSWIAVGAAMLTRFLGMRQIGPVKSDMRDPALEWTKLFGLFGTYGLPVVVATLLYEAIGGEVPTMTASAGAAARIALCSVVLVLTNNLVMARVERAYGYTPEKSFRLALIDSGIYMLTLPYAICMTFAYGAIGWGAVLALAFSGAVANSVARNLALTRSASQQQLQRLASLTNIGKMISLDFTKQQLLMTIYTECKKVVDCSIFSIALYDEKTDELVFELDVRDGRRHPRERMPVGEGLNSWVVKTHEPLLLRSMKEERQLGLVSVDDQVPTESWLGVPMLSRDRVIGVISVQSYKKNAFSNDDIVLMTAIANQAAVALENANLYRDLEGLTIALEHRVLERTNELREANLRLLAADRSKNQFLANMSHELRTPLNSIIGFSTVLLDNTRSLLQPRLYKFLENIQVAGTHLLELINDILDLSKIEAGKMQLVSEPFDIRDTISSAERVIRGLASESKINIVSSVAPDVPRVTLDEGRVKQILFNLLSNAVKFSPPESLVRVDTTFVPRGESPIGVDALRIEVADEGCGIAEEELKKIFEEFYQTDEGRKSRRGGTGLGLSLVRNFVELHRGIIEVRSTVGKGSTFTTYLPTDLDQARGLPFLRERSERRATA